MIEKKSDIEKRHTATEFLKPKSKNQCYKINKGLWGRYLEFGSDARDYHLVEGLDYLLCLHEQLP